MDTSARNELAGLLERATRIFCASTEGEDRGLMSAYWTNVAWLAAHDLNDLARYLDLEHKLQDAGIDDDAYDAVLDEQAALMSKHNPA